MREEFCTLFDVNYLTRGIVLWRSLTEVCSEFRLRVFCMDDEVERLLRRLALRHVEIVPLGALEAHDPDLQAVKATRSQTEYCWTATPAICLFALEREPELEMVTYLDADLMFHDAPGPLFDELGSDSVLIVPHRYTERWRGWEERGGIYNVQFLTFRRDANGLATLRWWRERCLEWCYDRVEDGRFGDQQHLDDWPERFQAVHVLQHPGGGVAPWNSGRYRLRRLDGKLVIDDHPLIFFHHESLQLYHRMLAVRRLTMRGRPFGSTDAPVRMLWAPAAAYDISADERALLWAPYAQRISEAIAGVRALEPSFTEGFADARLREVAGRVASRALPRLRLGPGRSHA